MGKHSYIGLSVEGQQILAVKVEYSRGTYTVTDSEQINVAELIQNTAEAVPEEDISAGEDLFGFGEAESPSTVMTMESDSDQSQQESEFSDDFMLGQNDVQQEITTKVVKDLHEVLVKFGGSKIEVGLTIPTGNVMFNTIAKPKDLKKKEKINTYVKSKVQDIYGVENVSDDNFKWVEDNDALAVASTLESSMLLELLERLNILYPHTIFIRSLIPEEISLMRFVAQKDEKSQGSTVVIALLKEGTRIIFGNKNKIQSAMPVIPMKTSGRGFINKVFSRIMMELEKGQVNYVDHFLVYDRVGDGHLLMQMLDQNFEGIKSEMITTGEGIVFQGEIENNHDTNISPHLPSVAAAIAASGKPVQLESDFNFVPSTILERQKIFKLKWHGILLLALIAITPVLMNVIYQDLASKNRELGFEMERNAQQIEAFQEVQAQITMLESENNVLTTQLSKVEEISKESYLWSETLNLLTDGVESSRNTWISSLQYSQQGFVIEGLTLFRERIPRIANTFSESGVQRVTVTEIRERNIFTFTIVVDKITNDPSIFDPQVPIDGEVNL